MEKIDKTCKDSGIKIRAESPAMAIYYGIDENTGMMDVEVRFPLDKKCATKDETIIFQIPEREVVSVVFKSLSDMTGI
jgi:hypothetical protein